MPTPKRSRPCSLNSATPQRQPNCSVASAVRLERPSSRVLVAESEDGVVGCLSAELVPYFPNGSTICRVTAIVVSVAYRRRGVGAALLAGAAEFPREHHCSGVE